MLRVRAYAKVNLTLEVLGQRPDGYHEIASVLQTIGLFDTLTVQPSAALDFSCDVPELDSPQNLAFQAACLLQEVAGNSRGASIHLAKGIPVAAGLGGGSSDAAASLRALNRLWGLHLPTPKLEDLAAQLGSDVPFFLHGGTALAEGRGERVTPSPPMSPGWWLLVRPPLELSDKAQRVYALLRPENYGDGSSTRRLMDRLLSKGLVAGSELEEFLFNVFDAIVFKAFPEVEKCRRQVEAAGGRELHLAGTGPTLFTPLAEEQTGRALLKRLKGLRLEAFLVPTVDSATSLSMEESLVLGQGDLGEKLRDVAT